MYLPLTSALCPPCDLPLTRSRSPADVAPQERIIANFASAADSGGGFRDALDDLLDEIGEMTVEDEDDEGGQESSASLEARTAVAASHGKARATIEHPLALAPVLSPGCTAASCPG